MFNPAEDPLNTAFMTPEEIQAAIQHANTIQATMEQINNQLRQTAAQATPEELERLQQTQGADLAQTIQANFRLVADAIAEQETPF